ncbi:hypothetical protein KT997_16130 [Proteus mirabilis]|uniref:hypothetical protein n=1 Tax=Proteus mirabilis TaxID=584 RepID=UPI002181F9EF|nr:hypothetical protein [Proteus mirabilis]MCT0083851.1 hypothetical protein [Proteus mirabilis]
MKKLLFLLIFTLAGCDSQSEIYGYWKNINSDCDVLCSFSIKKQDTAYSDSVVIFDKGPFYKAASGPLIQDKNNKNRYLVRGATGDFLLVLKNGRFFGTNNNFIYEKISEE